MKFIGISNSQISKTRYHFQAAKVIENPARNNNRKKKKIPKHPFSLEHRPPMCSPSRFFPASRFSSLPPPVVPCRKGITERIAAHGEISIRRYRLANNANRPTGVGRRLIASHCTRRIVFAVVYRELPPWALLSLIKWLIWARKIWSALRFDISPSPSFRLPFTQFSLPLYAAAY